MGQAVNTTRIMQWFELAYAYVFPTAQPSSTRESCLDLWNHFEGLKPEEDGSLEYEWRELKDAVADVS